MAYRTISYSNDLRGDGRTQCINWGRFKNEVDIMMSRNNPMKAKVAVAALGVIGGVLSVTEKLGMKI